MTVETRTTIQLSDIANVEFECRKCGSKTVWPIGVAKSPPIKCHCEEQQWMVHGGDQFMSIARLLQLIQKVGEAQNEPFIMRFGLLASVHASSEKD
jgi:hypothetical protein